MEIMKIQISHRDKKRSKFYKFLKLYYYTNSLFFFRNLGILRDSTKILQRRKFLRALHRFRELTFHSRN